MRVLFLIAALLVTSCSGKQESLMYFTPKVQVESSDESVVLSDPFVGSDDVLNKHLSLKPIKGFARYHLTASALVSNPVICGDRIFTLDSRSNVACFDLKTNKTLWRYNIGDNKNISGGGIYHYNNALYVTNGSRSLVVLDSASGYEIMRKLLPDLCKTSPIVYNDIVYVLTVGNQFCSLSLSSGKILWQQENSPQVLSTTNNVVPFIYKNKVVVPYYSDRIVAFDYNTGKPEWDSDLSHSLDTEQLPTFMPAGFKTQPIVDSSYAYAATNSGALLKINLEDGKVFWKKNLEDVHSIGRAKNAIFVTNNANQVAALSMQDGKVIWSCDLREEKQKVPAFLLSPVVINNQIVVVTSNGKIHSLNHENGNVVNTFKIDKGAKFIAAAGENFLVFTKTNLLIFNF